MGQHAISAHSAWQARSSPAASPRGNDRARSANPGLFVKKARYASGGSTKPGGTGKPPCVSLARLAPLPPARGASRRAGDQKSSRSIVVILVHGVGRQMVSCVATRFVFVF